MTSNPLKAANPHSSSSGKMQPGETKTIIVGDKTVTIIRAHRDYVHDLCDAYNSVRTHDDTQWIVDESGNLKLRKIDADSAHSRFMAKAKARTLTRDEFYNASLQWKAIAAEAGYVTHLGGQRYKVRPDREPKDEAA